jgi:hypothetical protein
LKATICGDGSSQTHMKGYGNLINSIGVSGVQQYFRGNACVSLGLDRKILRTENQIPEKWYCILPDRSKPLQPILTPAILEPVDPKMLEGSFPSEFLKQEMCGERFLQIPEEVRNAYFEEEGVSVTCCADGMRPVIFKIERIE